MTIELVSAINVVANACTNDFEEKSFDVIRKALDAVDNASANSDYTAALSAELKQWINEQPSVIGEKEVVELATRLNAALQKQHCA